MHFRTATVAQLTEFDEIIDVRTPAEFAEDHIPGARNCPVLSNEERVTVGTVYKQVSPFEARKLGAALAARNIAHHLQTVLHDRPKSWKPLVYCWRGGQRSGAMTIVLNQVGWSAHQLQGGYKAYRQDTLQQLASLPERYRYCVVCGPTGSGKSRLLSALARQGLQVLDLEALASHRGSVLGRLPQAPQPSQKWFDSLLRQHLAGFDPSQPVYVESESRKIGAIALPDALVKSMHAGDCLLVQVPLAERTRFLLEDYDFYLREPERLLTQLEVLKPLHGSVQLAQWEALVHAGEFATLVQDLLTRHYDPAYQRSMHNHYAQLALAPRIMLESLSDAALDAAAAGLGAHSALQHA